MEFDSNLTEARRQQMVEQGLWQNKTALDYFNKALKNHPDKHALTSVSAITKQRQDFSYRDLEKITNRIAVGLLKLGIQRNDVVTCQLPNSWQFCALYLACCKISAVFNPVMPIFRQHELNFMLRHGETKLFVIPHIFRDFDHYTMAKNMQLALPDLEHIVVVGGDDPNSFDRLLNNPDFDDDPLQETLVNLPKQAPDNVCQLIYTSGTTGEPKGVMHTANTMFSNLVCYAERLKLSSGDKVFMFSPMAHQTGFMYGVLLPLYLAAPVIVLDIWDRDLAADIIAQDKVTFTMASTPFLMDLTDTVKQRKSDSSSLRIFVCAGAAIPTPVVERGHRILGCSIVPAWGMTENGVLTLINPHDPLEKAAYTDGFPLPGVDIKILTHDGHEAESGEEGELYIRACSNFVGYLKRPQWNNIDEQGWFDTGDIARRDNEGYIRICGRSKDIIIRGAENIPVITVETLLYGHPAIAGVALVGYPDPRLGERACAFVTLREDHHFDFDEMHTYLKQQNLALQYFPERLEILPSFPTTAAGKIQKFKLRQMLQY